MGTTTLNTSVTRTDSFRLMRSEASHSSSIYSNTTSSKNLDRPSSSFVKNTNICGTTNDRTVQTSNLEEFNMIESLIDESSFLFRENASRGRHAQKHGDHKQALAFYRYALLCKKNSIQSESTTIQIEYADVLFEVGIIYMEYFDNSTFSAEALQQCLDLRISCLGTSHIDVSATMMHLANAHMIIGNDRDYARELLIESLSILLLVCPNNTLTIVRVWKELARVQYALGDVDDAESSICEIRRLNAQLSPFL